MSERCERTSERASEWLSTYVPIKAYLNHCAFINRKVVGRDANPFEHCQCRSITQISSELEKSLLFTLGAPNPIRVFLFKTIIILNLIALITLPLENQISFSSSGPIEGNDPSRPPLQIFDDHLFVFFFIFLPKH